jgi:F-type H+-transporting ATPase subunit b
MEIDWITVSAQVVNFLILVYLLKRFLYAPVMRAMDRREQRIAERLNEAKNREQKANDEAQRFRDRSEDLERRRGELMAKAKEQAEAERQQMLDAARDEVGETRLQWQRQVELEKDEFLEALRKRTAEAVQDVARKALADLADARLEEQVAETFVNRLKALDKDTRKAFADSKAPVCVATSFELDSAVRGRLTRAIHEHLTSEAEVSYDQSPELLCGIELSTSGRRLSWSLADYLDQLGVRMEDAFATVR